MESLGFAPGHVLAIMPSAVSPSYVAEECGLEQEMEFVVKIIRVLGSDGSFRSWII